MEKQLLDRITPADRGALSEVRRSLNEAHRAWNQIESGKQCEERHAPRRKLAGVLPVVGCPGGGRVDRTVQGGRQGIR